MLGGCKAIGAKERNREARCDRKLAIPRGIRCKVNGFFGACYRSTAWIAIALPVSR